MIGAAKAGFAMAKVDIWMPLYIGDYMADTMCLTTEQHGAYLLLLMEQWMTGPIKDDDEDLAAITKLPIDQWRNQRGKLARFFKIESGLWSQPRLAAEKEAAESRRKAAADNGKKGGRPKIGDNPEITHGLSEGLPSSNPNHNPQKSSSPSPSPILQTIVCNTMDSPHSLVDPPPKKKRRTKIPDDHVLTTDLRDRALLYWLDRNRTDLNPDDEFGKFIASHRSRGTTMVNWDAAWQTWYSNAPKFNPPPKGATNGTNQHSSRSAVDRVNDAISRRAREREETLSAQGRTFDHAGNIVETI